jgi:hypothetical protein
MKHLIFILCVACSTIICTAQTEHTLKLSGYNNNVSIIVQDKKAIFVNKGDSVQLPLAIKNNLLEANKADEAKVLALLAFSEQNTVSVSQKYTVQYPGLSVVNQIINKAKDLGGNMIITKATANGNTQDTITEITVEDDVPLQNLEQKPASNWLSYLWIPFALLSTILAWLLFKPKSKTNNIEATLNTTQTNNNNADAQQIQQLQQNLKAVSAQLANAQAADAKYYSTLLNNYLLPAKQALENGDKAKASELLVASLYHSIAKANAVLGSRSQSDVNNIAIVEGNYNTTNVPVINKDSNQDAIQKELKNIIAYLKDNGATQITNTVILDHSINSI